MFAFPLVHPGKLVEVHDLARDLHLNFRRIEASNASNPAFSRQDSLGERSVPYAIGAHRPHPCGLLSGFKSIAMPQLWADSLLPVRWGRKAKHPPKLVILSCSPPSWMLPKTNEKTRVRRRWHVIWVIVRDGSRDKRSENGKL